MDVTPQLLREVEFREQRKGYDPKEVDDFLERVAVAFGQLRSQLDEALGRAERAERRVLESPADEDELRRTLVLATRTAEAAREEARQSAEATLRAAEERAAVTIRDAEAHAAAVVGEAEGRVERELSPLLEQREALVSDIEALEGWAADVRRRLTEEARQQLAWLEGERAELPARPELAAVSLATGAGVDDDLATVPAEPGGAGGGPYGIADGWDPTPPDVRVGERPPAVDDTAAFDVLVAADDDDGAAAPSSPAGGAAAGDDPFLDELRRAVDDDEPLGPRDGGPGPAAPEGDPEPDLATPEDPVAEQPGSVSGDGAPEDGESSFWRRKPQRS
jgi:cell division initiation protein